MAGILGAAALAISQLSAADPSPGSTPAPKESSVTQGPSSSGDPKQACGYDHFGRAGKKSRGHGHGWERRWGHGNEEAMLDRLLNLTDDQKQKVKGIIEAGRPKIKAIKEEERAKIQAVKDEMRQQIRPILTPDQQKVLDDAQKLRDSAKQLREDARKLHQEEDDQS